MRGEQSPTISPMSRWLKALKSRPPRLPGASALGAGVIPADQCRGNRATRRAGDSEDRHVIVKRVGGESAQGPLEALHRTRRVDRPRERGAHSLLAKPPVIALGLDDAIGGHHQLLARLDPALADPPLAV